MRKWLNEGLADAFDSDVVDYSKEYEKKEDYILRDTLAQFIENFSDEKYSIEYIDGERYINVRGKVTIMVGASETKIPIKFNKIEGDFNCSFCGLTTLENCPKIVTGEFNCSYNNLKNLDFIPIANSYNLSFNNLSLGAINTLIDTMKHSERKPRHNLDRLAAAGKYNKDNVDYMRREMNGVDSSKTSFINIKGNPRLLKYINHPNYREWMYSSWND